MIPLTIVFILIALWIFGMFSTFIVGRLSGIGHVFIQLEKYATTDCDREALKRLYDRWEADNA